MKKSLKKGGVAEIVSLMIIVGIVLALIIAVVLPIVQDARETGNQNRKDQEQIRGSVEVGAEGLQTGNQKV